jgi:hypothetical protein
MFHHVGIDNIQTALRVYYFQELYRKTDLLQFYFDSSNEKTQVTA